MSGEEEISEANEYGNSVSRDIEHMKAGRYKRET
jgi:hypothetical protein